MTAAALSTRTNADGSLTVAIGGEWRLGERLPDVVEITERLAARPAPVAVRFDDAELGTWDTALVTRLIAIVSAAEAAHVDVDQSGLPEGAVKLLELAFTVEERTDAHRDPHDKSFLELAGSGALDAWHAGIALLTFIGELTLSFGRLLRGHAELSTRRLLVYIQEAGAEALPIVGVISLLIGMIFAFVGVMQLSDFGVGIYTANLVAVAMVREISAIMTAIVMAGRTGAAYAAEIGTMKVNEEIDALTTLGINPVDFLVAPRVIALVTMMPLLTMFASLMGILGGTLVALAMLDVTFVQYVEQTYQAVGLASLFGGLFKSIVYGSLVAIAGCMQGIACGSSALAVGVATTKAVVMGIVLIIVSAAVLTVIYVNLGI